MTSVNSAGLIGKISIAIMVMALAPGFDAHAGTTIDYSVGGSTYTQDFNLLPATGAFTPTPAAPLVHLTSGAASNMGFNVALDGWYFGNAITPTPGNINFIVSDGSTATLGAQSLGTTSATDRAFGGFVTGSTVLPRVGAVFTNNTGGTLSSVTITFRQEQWRGGAAANIQDTFTFSYKLDTSSINDTTGFINTGVTPVGGLNFAVLNTTTFNAALNGNVAPNFSTRSATISGLTWTNGGTLALRWTDANDPDGSDEIMGLDDFTLIALRPPAVWDGSTSASWSDGTNWVSGVAPGAGDSVTLTGAGNAPTSMDISGLSISSLAFDNTTTTPIVVILGGAATGLTLTSSTTVDTAAADHTLALPIALGGALGVTVGANRTLTMSGLISGANALSVSGSGTLALTNAANTYSGVTTIGSGATLSVTTLANGGAPSSIGQSASAPASLILAGGTLLYVGGAVTTDRGMTVSAPSGTINFLTAATNLQINGQITGSAPLAVGSGGAAGVLTLGGADDNTTLPLIVNSGSVVLAKSSTAAIHAVNGAVIVNANGTLRFAGTGGDQVGDTAAVTLNTNGIIDLNGNGEGISSLAGSGGTITNSGAVDSVITLGTNNGTGATWAGVIQNGGTNSTALAKTGTGTQTLTGVSTFTGGTTLNAGTLSVNSINDGPSALGVLASGVTFTGGALQYTGGTVSSTRVFLVNTGGGTIDVSSAASTLTLEGTITSGAALTKLGAGTLAFNTMQTFSAVNLNAGTVLLNAAASFAGGTLNLGGGQLRGTGTNTPGYSVTSAAASTGTIWPGSTSAAPILADEVLFVSSLNLSNGGTLRLLVASGGFEQKLTVSGAVTLGGSSKLVLVADAGNYGDVTILESSAGGINSAFPTVSGLSGNQSVAYLDGGGNIVNPSITPATRVVLRTNTDTVTWNTISGVWNTTDLNWLKNGIPAAYTEGDLVVFPEPVAASVVTIQAGGVLPGKVTVANSANKYTFAGGALNGASTLTKSNAGILELSVPNNYTGDTIINGGVLSFAATTALGTTGIIRIAGTNLANAATLQYTGAGRNLLNTFIDFGVNSDANVIDVTDVNGELNLSVTTNTALNPVKFLSGGAVGITVLRKTGPGLFGGTHNGLPAGNSTVVGDTWIQNGTIRCEPKTIQSRFLGSEATNTIRIGNTAGADSATLLLGSDGSVMANPIIIEAGSSGTATMGTANQTGNSVFSGQVTLRKNLTLTGGVGFTTSGTDYTTGNSAPNTLSGRITGTGDLIIQNASTSSPFTQVINLTNGTNNFIGDIYVVPHATVPTNLTVLSLGTNGCIPNTTRLIISTGQTARLADFSEGIGSLVGSGTFDGTFNRTLSISDNLTSVFTGPITNSANSLAVTKNGNGTQTLGGTNTYTGVTSVNAGTLKLDYSVNDNSKLSGSNALVLGNGTLELAGGTHLEIVGSTTLTAGAHSRVNLSSGAAVLQMNVITPGNGSLVHFGNTNIASTDTINNAITGILGPWATISVAGETQWAVNSTNAADGLITGYTAYTDITRLDGTIPNTAAANVRIINGGTTNNIAFATGTNINTLKMEANDGAAVIAAAVATDVLKIGGNTGGSILQSASSGGLTVGATFGSCILTTGATADNVPASINLINEHTTIDLVINSAIQNNGSDVVSISKSGVGRVVLAGANTIGGTVTIPSGELFVGVLTGPSTATTLGGITAVTNNGSLVFRRTSNTTGNVAGGISGTGSVTYLGSGIINEGTFTADDASTYSGGALVDGGRVSVTNATGLGTGLATARNAGQIYTTQAITNPLNLSGNGFLETEGQLGALRLQGGTASGAIVLSGNSLITAYSGDGTLSGAISESGGVRNLVFGGDNNRTLTLSGTTPNSYTGLTTVHAQASGNAVAAKITLALNKTAGVNAIPGNLQIGSVNNQSDTVQLNANNQIGDVFGVNIASSAGVLNLNGFSETIGALSGVAGSQVALGAGTLTLGDASNTIFEGAISGGGGVTKVGSGVLLLTGASSYTGATVVNAGTLGGTPILSSPVTVGAAGTIQPGLMAITGPFSAPSADFSSGGTLRVRVANTLAVPAPESDLLQLNDVGNATALKMGGTSKLVVDLSGLAADPGNVFIVIAQGPTWSSGTGNGFVSVQFTPSALFGANIQYVNNGSGAGTSKQLIVAFGNNVTPVKIDDLATSVVGAGVQVSWTAVSEYQNAGFNVYRRTLEGGTWIKANALLISGRITDPDEKKYSFHDWTPVGMYMYRLESVSIKGESEFFIPQSALVTTDWNYNYQSSEPITEYSVQIAERSLVQIESAKSAARTTELFKAVPTPLASVRTMMPDKRAMAVAPANQSVAGIRWFSSNRIGGAPAQSSAKVLYSKAGVMLIPQSAMPAGFDIAHVTLQREGRNFKALAVTPAGLLVYAPGYEDDYTNKDAIVLRRTVGATPAGSITAAVNLFSSAVPVNVTSPATVSQAYHDVYFDYSMRPYNFKPWFSAKYLTQGSAQTFALTTPSASSGPGSLTLNLWSLTPGDHAIQVVINGQPIGESSWNGGDKMVEISLAIPAGVLLNGENSIVLVTPGGENQIAFVHSMSAGYTRLLDASNTMEVINSGTSARLFELYNVPAGGAKVVDTRFTDRAELVPVQTALQADGSYRLRFMAPSGGSGKFLVVPAGQENAPLSVRTCQVKPLRLNGTYLATGPNHFAGAVQPLLVARARTGIRGAFVDQEALFDYYNHGRYGPAGIQNAVRATRPQYLLLVGRTTYDYKNYSGVTVDPLCPTFLVSTHFWAQTTSDSRFGDLGRGFPQVAVGRLPVNTTGELQNAVQHILNHKGFPSAGSGVRIHAVADSVDPEVGDFAQQLGGLKQSNPELSWQANYLGLTHSTAGEVRSAMAEAANGGADMILYGGHGSASRLGRNSPHILDTAGVTEWRGNTVFLQATCTAHWMAKNEDGYKSIAIQALTQPQGGISASIGTSAYMSPDAASAFMNQLLKNASVKGMRWGSALLKTQVWAGTQTTNPFYTDLMNSEQLFGDPAMPIYMIPGSSRSATTAPASGTF